jgi:hypothetical protein
MPAATSRPRPRRLPKFSRKIFRPKRRAGAERKRKSQS